MHLALANIIVWVRHWRVASSIGHLQR